MQVIKINVDVTEDEFNKYSLKWASSSDCSIILPDIMSASEIHSLCIMALKCKPSDFSYSVLESLAELDCTSDGDLCLIFNAGDRGCIESVCLREKLPNDLRELCKLKSLHKQIGELTGSVTNEDYSDKL